MGLTQEEIEELSVEGRNERFRICCGAYVEGADNCYKGEKVKHDLRTAERLRTAGGVEVNDADVEGWTALHWASAEGRTRVVTYLLDAEKCAANVDVVDLVGCTPLWVAAYNGEYQTALLLLGAGADLTIKGQPKGEPIAMTPGHAARSQGKPAIADMIDAEKKLREGDPKRIEKLRSGGITTDEFRASLRAMPKSDARILPISMNPYR